MMSGSQSPSSLLQPVCRSAAQTADFYRLVRDASMELIEGLSPEDCQAQSMPDASPVKWHLAHTTWFFETLVLEGFSGRFEPFNPAFRVLYNSYYNTIGDQFPRPQRGLVTRPSLGEVLDYRRHVDDAVLSLLESDSAGDELVRIVVTGLNHEQQHQELMLTDLKHLFSCNPLFPSYREVPEPDSFEPADMTWFEYPEGLQWIGHDGNEFAFDSEGPRHRVFVEAFRLASRLVGNGDYLDFIKDGGYSRPELWLSEGWAVVQEQGWQAPLYWVRRDGRWYELKLSGLQPLRPESPVCHVSGFEADAYARWADARLPREAELEVAAQGVPLEGNFVESGALHPLPHPNSSQDHPAQLFGDAWEWTSSAYATYPGYVAPQGALGEYNAKFASSQLILRGGSCATPRTHFRPTYRNFFPPTARWQFTGIRLARDCSDAD